MRVVRTLPSEPLPEPNPGPQRLLYETEAKEVLYGGAKGGGKSFALLLKACKICLTHPTARVLVVRNTFEELKSLIETSRKVMCHFGATLRKSGVEAGWTFANGARVVFGYMDGPNGSRWQGNNPTTALIDEAGEIGDYSLIANIAKELRSAHGVPAQVIMTANPGGPGETWLMERFINDAKDEPRLTTQGDTVTCKVHTGRLFIPARLTDNPHLASTDYQERLEDVLSGNDRLYQALIHGVWGVPPDSKIFKVDMFNREPKLDAQFIRTVWSWDTAYSTADGRSFSAGVLLGIDTLGRLWVLDALKARAEWDDLVPMVRNCYRDFRSDAVLIEAQANGISLGQTLAREGIPVEMFKPRNVQVSSSLGAKAARHTLSMMEVTQVGGVRVAPFKGREAFLNELFTQPANKVKDYPDAFAQGVIHMLQSPRKRVITRSDGEDDALRGVFL
jgi:phage terminase large subunit-like protein